MQRVLVSDNSKNTLIPCINARIRFLSLQKKDCYSYSNHINILTKKGEWQENSYHT
jgi:hypothetical protein